MNSDYREEIKYVVNTKSFNILKNNFDRLLKKDRNAKDGYYVITSIYFDNYKKESYNQVKDGISLRWKYRIRFYNYDDSFIRLEKKYKRNGLTKKIGIQITKEEFNKILKGSIKISKDNSELLNELIVKMNTEYLRPIICIEYSRIPYIGVLNDVRITLDYDICYCKKFDNLFDKDKKVYYINEQVLEIKYNNYIPDFILDNLKYTNLSTSSFSKYKNCIDDYSRRFL